MHARREHAESRVHARGEHAACMLITPGDRVGESVSHSSLLHQKTRK